MDKLKPKLYHSPLQLQPLNLSALGYWKVLLRLSLNLSMAPAALYLKPIRSMGFSTEVKVGLGVGITAILVAILAAFLQLLSWRYPVWMDMSPSNHEQESFVLVCDEDAEHYCTATDHI
ncbi:hypothetical protein THAR02_04794 [Trichoderma harzianum]|uniref:Uncharacterized protein n=1 Tax=Trichoderma harzianum TaxID=5544 RepID=A0A0F9XSE2_TRIHA|nr:hypothetical protein THAR02_04794 [Trichoderma harzianum]